MFSNIKWFYSSRISNNMDISLLFMFATLAIGATGYSLSDTGEFVSKDILLERKIIANNEAMALEKQKILADYYLFKYNYVEPVPDLELNDDVIFGGVPLPDIEEIPETSNKDIEMLITCKDQTYVSILNSSITVKCQ